MRILAIETATEGCSAALLIDGEVRERFEVSPRGHSRLILPMMDELLSEAGLRPIDLDAFAFGRGPGSFTGVRIATGVIQGAAFAADVPVVPVSTLAALAHGQYRADGPAHVLAAIDARMREVYCGAYRIRSSGVADLLGEERVCPATDVTVPGAGDWQGAGSGWSDYGDILTQRIGHRLRGIDADALPHAADVVLLAATAFANGQAVSAEQALPVYLRNDVAQKSRLM